MGLDSAVSSETRTQGSNAPGAGGQRYSVGAGDRQRFHGHGERADQQQQHAPRLQAGTAEQLLQFEFVSNQWGHAGVQGPTRALVSVGSLTINSYDTATASYDITEQQDNFTVDSNTGHSTLRMAGDTPTSDVNGNLTYDGDETYVYDAWNRIRTITHGYRDSSNTLHAGQALDSIMYDGRGRRIIKSVTGTRGVGLHVRLLHGRQQCSRGAEWQRPDDQADGLGQAVH